VKRWIWISLPYATFGIAVAGGVVAEAPPIAKWALGRDERDVAGYFRRRGAKIVALDARDAVPHATPRARH
jgi:hypothetical protein